MKKNRIVLTGLLLAAACILLLYRPIRENEVYSREVKLPEFSQIQENSMSSAKMIKRAKNTLENVFAVEIDEEQYNIEVTYESYEISNYTTAYGKQNLSFANIIFNSKNTGESEYIVACDTASGEILMITQRYESPEGVTYLPVEELERTAKEFFKKITGMEESQILFFDDGIQAETYHMNLTLKDSYEAITLYLDAFDGTVFYYRKGN